MINQVNFFLSIIVNTYLDQVRKEIALLEKEEDRQLIEVNINTSKEEEIKVKNEQPQSNVVNDEKKISPDNKTEDDVNKWEEKDIVPNKNSKKEALKKLFENEGKSTDKNSQPNNKQKLENDDEPEIEKIETNEEIKQIHKKTNNQPQNNNSINANNFGMDEKMMNEYKNKIDSMVTLLN